MVVSFRRTFRRYDSTPGQLQCEPQHVVGLGPHRARRAYEWARDREADMRLAGKVALISGGARGMGAAEAKMFAREGAQVVIGDVLEAEGRAVAAEVAATGGKAAFVRLDVTREPGWQAAGSAAAQRFGKLNVLVNNAGLRAAGRGAGPPLEARQRGTDGNA